MTILIADSGSTKTHWELWDGQEWHTLVTEGLNPYYTSDAALENALEEVSALGTEGSHLYFYGAGCTGENARKRLTPAMERILKASHIEIESDLLAACRATCGKEAGMTAILGTGSSSCLYDGQTIVHSIAPLGYALGCDEGSGNAIGRSLLKSYLREQMPTEIHRRFQAQYPQDREGFLEQIYHRPNPNRYLAGMARFAYENIEDPWIRRLVEEEMDRFFSEQIDRYGHPELKLNLIGSVAAGFEEILRTIGARHKATIGRVDKEPMEGLKQFHNPGIHPLDTKKN